MRWQRRANSVASRKWRRTRAALKRLRGVVGKRSAAGVGPSGALAAGAAGAAGCAAGAAGSGAGSMAAGSYMRGAGGALLCGGGRRSSPGMFFWADAGARCWAAAAARRLRGGLGEPQRLRRLCGWRYLGWFRHGICGESRGCGGGEAPARAGVSGVRVAGAGAGLDLLKYELGVV